MEHVGGRRYFHDFQDICCATKRKISETFSETFEFNTDSIGQMGPANTALSVELVCVSCSLATAQVAAKTAKAQFDSSQQRHDTWESNFLAGFKMVRLPRSKKQRVCVSNVKELKIISPTSG